MMILQCSLPFKKGTSSTDKTEIKLVLDSENNIDVFQDNVFEISGGYDIVKNEDNTYTITKTDESYPCIMYSMPETNCIIEGICKENGQGAGNTYVNDSSSGYTNISTMPNLNEGQVYKLFLSDSTYSDEAGITNYGLEIKNSITVRKIWQMPNGVLWN